MSERIEWVKLHVQMQESNDTIIVENHKAKAWDDFLIIEIDVPNFSPEQWEEMAKSIAPIAEEMSKKVIIVPSSMKVNFYRIEKYIEDDES